MNPGKEYAAMINEQNKLARQQPFGMAWEFMPRPIAQPIQYESDTLATLARTNRWQLTWPIQQLFSQQEWAVIVTDRWEIIQYVNPLFEQMTGYEIAEVTGRKPNFLQGRDTDLATRKRMRIAIDQQQPIKDNMLNYKKDGTKYWCNVTIFPVRNDQKQVVNYIALEQETPV